MTEPVIMPNSLLEAKPSVVLRENLEDSAVLYDPDSGRAFSINDVGLDIWKMLDGKSSLQAIIERLRQQYEEATQEDEMLPELQDFLLRLVQNGLAGYAVRE